MLAFAMLALLNVGTTTRGELKAGETRSFEIDFGRNKLLEVRVLQGNIDLEVRIENSGDPLGDVINHSEFGVERALISPRDGSRRRLHVTASANSSAKGWFELKLKPVVSPQNWMEIIEVQRELSDILRTETPFADERRLSDLFRRAKSSKDHYLVAVVGQQLSRRLHRRERLSAALSVQIGLDRKWRTLGDPARQFEALREMTRLYGRTERPLLSKRYREATIAIGNRSGDDRLRLVAQRLSQQNSKASNSASSTDVNGDERILRSQLRLGPFSEALSTLERLAKVRREMHHFAAAEANVEQMELLAAQHGKKLDEATAAYSRAALMAERCRFQEAIAAYRRGIDIDRAIGSPRQFGAAVDIARCLTSLGKYEEALDALKDAETEVRSLALREPSRASHTGFTRLTSARTEALLNLAKAEGNQTAIRNALIKLDADRSGRDPMQAETDVDWLISILGPRTALVTYFTLDPHPGQTEQMYAWSWDRRGLRLIDLGDSRPILSLVRQANRSSRSCQEFSRVSAALSRHLLVPLKLPDDVTRLAIVPGINLERVPWSALPHPIKVERVLASEVTVSLAPSLSDLADIMRSTSVKADHQIAMVFDPVFSASDPRSRHHDVHLGADSTVRNAVRSVGLRGPEPARLIHSRREAQLISSYSSDFTPVSGFSANKNDIVRGALKNYRILHFATHGMANSRNRELSGLLLSMLNGDGKRVPGLLDVNEIEQLKLNAEIAVLSACQTGLGRGYEPFGLFSPARAFLRAGARTVIASLWQVDDEATAELMGHFYRNLLRDGISPAEALRLAQLRIRSVPRWKAPYYWAGFMVHGAWN